MATRRSPDALKPADTAPVADNSTRRPVRPRSSSATTPAPAQLSPDLRHALIAENAYLRAERRGFAPGHETEDWLEAEAEVDALLKAEQTPRQ
ncbi:MAG TPA: DUF2934 domain-containing protein [Steroidobacteraceae bacterium]|nr:DUF2934 domain-containing protein [Steroidobacteraceae bacterium]